MEYRKSLHHRWQLLPSGFQTTATIHLVLKEGQLSELYDHFAKNILPQEIFRGMPLKNMRGRDNVMSPSYDPNATVENELLYCNGISFYSEEPELLEPAKKTSSFSFTSRSSFQSSTGGSLRFNTNPNQNGILTKEVNPQDYGRMFPAELSYFRAGLLFYRSSFFSNLTGSNPMLAGHLLVEATNDHCCMILMANGQKGRKNLPELPQDYTEKVKVNLLNLFGIDIFETKEDGH